MWKIFYFMTYRDWRIYLWIVNWIVSELLSVVGLMLKTLRTCYLIWIVSCGIDWSQNGSRNWNRNGRGNGNRNVRGNVGRNWSWNWCGNWSWNWCGNWNWNWCGNRCRNWSRNWSRNGLILRNVLLRRSRVCILSSRTLINNLWSVVILLLRLLWLSCIISNGTWI